MGPSFLPAVVDREIGWVIVPTVDARQLHAALRVGTKFATWFRRRCKSLFLTEGEDYAEWVLPNSGQNPSRHGASSVGGAPSIEYLVTVWAAKKVAMAERNVIGDAVRDHFIRCEEGFRTADPAAYAESRERMREDIRAAGGGDRACSDDGDARVNPADGDPSLVGRLVDELVAMSAEARAMRARDTERTDREITALREMHNEAVERAGVLEDELAASELARRAAERAAVAARAARHDPDGDEGDADDAGGSPAHGAPEDPLRDEAELAAVLANLPHPDLTLGKGDATRADRTMAFRLSGCRPVKPRPFRFWRAEHGSPGIARGAVHYPGHATRGGNTRFMRMCAVRIFDALQALRRPSAPAGH